MQARVQALETETHALMTQMAVMAELAEEGSELAELTGLALVHEVERLEAEVAVERTRPEVTPE